MFSRVADIQERKEEKEEAQLGRKEGGAEERGNVGREREKKKKGGKVRGEGRK